jgi:hypothetical protein
MCDSMVYIPLPGQTPTEGASCPAPCCFVLVQDTEAALLRAAASQDGGGSSGGRGLSVSPDYIDALVQAAREPSVGE